MGEQHRRILVVDSNEGCVERKCACLGGVIALSIEDKMRGTNDEKRRGMSKSS